MTQRLNLQLLAFLAKQLRGLEVLETQKTIGPKKATIETKLDVETSTLSSLWLSFKAWTEA